MTIFLVGDTPLFLAVCCFWEIQNYSNPLAPVGHFIFLPGGPENFSESLKLHRFTILELSYGMKFWCIQNSESFFLFPVSFLGLWIMLLFFRLLERHRLHETFWTHLSLKLSFSWSSCFSSMRFIIFAFYSLVCWQFVT